MPALDEKGQGMKTVLITGATGDVGTHLRRELAGNTASFHPTSGR